MLVAVFVVSLVSKVRGRAAYADFRRSLVAWQVFPPRWSQAAAAGVVAGEAAVVGLLALPWTVPVGFAAAAVVLAAFTGGIVWALRRGRVTSCRCFGASTATLGPAHVIRNGLLLLVCAGGVVGGALAAGSPTVGGAALAVSAAAIGVLFVVRFDDIVALTRA
jgi:hypothetical protein